MSESPSSLERRAARNIAHRYLRVRSGENAIIESWPHTLPFATAMLDEFRQVGAKTLFVYNDEASWWRTFDRRQSKLLGESSAPEWAALKATDIYVNFWGPGDTSRMETLPDRTGNQAFAWNPPWYEVAQKAGLRGVRMTIGFVTDGRSRQWGWDRARWERRMLEASLVDPEELAASGARLRRALRGAHRVRITHANGTDVEVGLAGVAPRVTDGRPRPYRRGDSPSGMVQQVPSGAVSVALDSRTADGTFVANRRTNIWWNWHCGGSLSFAKGRMTSFSFRQGGKEFARQYRSGSAGRNRTGALTFGLNPAVRDVPNLETIERGSVTLVVGRNRASGGTNDSSFFNWVVVAGAEISVDGTPIVRAGKIL